MRALSLATGMRKTRSQAATHTNPWANASMGYPKHNHATVPARCWDRYLGFATKTPTPEQRRPPMGAIPAKTGTLGVPKPRRVVLLGPTRGSPSILRHPSSVGASGGARGHRAGLSSPPCRSPPRWPRRHPAPGGIWEPGGDREGKSGSSLGHRGHPNQALKFGAGRYLCFLDHFAEGPEEIPGQVPAEPPCGDTRVRDTSSPQPPHGTGPRASPPWGIPDPCGSLNPSQGGPRFGTHHREPPRR